MSKINNWVAKKYIEIKHREEEAQGLAEYGLILALVAVLCIVALTGLKDGIVGTLDTVAASL
jgi:pilus assembly protein Flp/PilA